MQKGDFLVDAVILDDASTDKTAKKCKKFIKNAVIPQNIKLKYQLNKTNLGMQGNLKQALQIFANCNADYCCILEGDDYWLTEDRLQQNVKLLNENQNYSMSFNALRLFYENENRFAEHVGQAKIKTESLTTNDLCKESLVGNLSASFYRAKHFKTFPLQIFDNAFVAEFLINAIISHEHGNVGYINKPLTVYRIHKSVWNGGKNSDQKNNYRILENVNLIKKLYPNCYDNELNEFLESAIKKYNKSTLYWKTENGSFCETESEKALINTENNNYKVIFNANLPNGVTHIRFDPIEGLYINCKIISITRGGKKLKLVKTARKIGCHFLTNDPWYEYKLSGEGKIEVIFSANQKLGE